ncbi:protein lethal(2)k10201-like [Amyelois transitella]|uniref:protein lethal(2)k10201 n=1 Tax=Amyelois transitella TaxID=680683 RepID=UPI00298FB395|nr:protein lethal(2)k10201 [Amyelois transitella]XP_013188363.2 protein lethal(2)k10201 [Amyelois transitella]XP_013188365.2 protein lethal(2)k10201 [Amyelois transitella]XP_060806665.1 protein lethal(2)k10201-like [Amyelois transitella]XP_060806666.1 protein lethal(2)k10201-like [Amyelois transitella]
MDMSTLLEQLDKYGVGRRKLDDHLFKDDPPLPRLGVYDVDDEDLCHEVITTTCAVPGCYYTTESLLSFENHYNSSHRYSCAQCKKVMPSPHLLDLHIQETHDSFFAVMAEKKPSYCCYIEECKEKFINAEERKSHCVKIHKLPKDFRFETNCKFQKQKKIKKRSSAMEVDGESSKDQKQFSFINGKQKFTYTGRKFTKNDEEKSKRHVNIDVVMEDLKESLPDS